MQDISGTIALLFAQVDDRRLVGKYLSSIGYRVTGFQEVFDTEVDLVIMDVFSARRFGKKVIEEVKTPDQFYLPVIVAVERYDDVSAWITAGYDECLRMPFTKAELENRVRVLLRLRQMNRELAYQSEAVYKALINSYEDHIFMLDDQGVFVSSNDRVEHFGLKKMTDICGKSIDDVYPAPVAILYRERLKEVISTGNNLTFEHIMPTDKGVRYHTDTLFPVMLKDGRLRIGGICRDITDQRKIEQHLQRTQRLEAIGTLAGGIAHDFNNILSPIMNYTYLCMRLAQPQSRLHEYLRNIMHSVERASDLVKQILSFSRGKGRELEPITIEPVIKEALKLMRAAMPADIEIVSRLKAGQKLIMADPTEVHQIVMNLCTNSQHAMRENGGRLTVFLEPVDVDRSFMLTHPEMKQGEYLRLSVEDTGHGMPEDVVNRIFEPYFTTKQNGEGTGLGLAVVHGIVRRMGGHIYCYSEPGRGTIFNLYFPVTDACSGAGTSVEITKIDVKGRKERIMFVDDEIRIVDTARMVLDGLGYDVTAFTDPLRALEHFCNNKSKYDLVITDMTMPGMTGDRLAQEILKESPGIPIILCTGFSERMNVERAGEIGVSKYLMKPINPVDLASAIRHLLDKKVGD